MLAEVVQQSLMHLHGQAQAGVVQLGGRKAGRRLVEKMKDQKGEVNIVELQGTVGSAPAIDRKKGFEEIIKAIPTVVR